MKRAIHILWLKRDFRWRDHVPLISALHEGLPVLCIAFIEPHLWQQPQFSQRHVRFILESAQQMNDQVGFNAVHVLHSEVLPVFQLLLNHFDIKSVFSHMETGTKWTFDRDLEMAMWFKNQGIAWHESVANGVRRGLRNRQDWVQKWYRDVAQPVLPAPIAQVRKQFMAIPEQLQSLKYAEVFEPHPYLQRGGEIRAHKVMNSFLYDRISNYAKSISKPLESRKGCSRISPHLAWGNLSVRQVVQAMNEAPHHKNKRNFRAFADRLRWQAHFIQKFESEWEYEFEPINKGYKNLPTVLNEEKFTAWKTGRTGVPLVDACMRCLQATGYLNFRMRAMVVSFYSHYLFLPWKPGADYLASLFTDFEPGIHYAQFQMQSGLTGINTIRIYNPIKQSKDHDPHGIFIKQWIPELHHIPEAYIHEPWDMPPIERELLGGTGGYPIVPIVDLKTARKYASDQLYSYKKSKSVRTDAKRILQKHVNPGPRNS